MVNEADITENVERQIRRAFGPGCVRADNSADLRFLGEDLRFLAERELHHSIGRESEDRAPELRRK